jgi:hypothetical protein
LDLDKPPLVLSGQEPLVALANNDPPAMFIIGNDSQDQAGTAASRIMHFLRNEPAQIDAGNALFSHFPAFQIFERIFSSPASVSLTSMR